jgi:alpha-galactosidase
MNKKTHLRNNQSMKTNPSNTRLAGRLTPVLALAVLALIETPPPLRAESPAAPVPAEILTPKPPATPRITGPKVFGVRPGNPFLFKVTATGDKPMTFTAENLPKGLALDPATGMITGSLAEKGETTATLTASNALGKNSRPFRIVCGDTIALTPPLGWNSWNFFANRVTEGDVRGAADAMVSSGLIDHGWTYINIDDCWEGKRDADGMIQGNEKFPNMKALGDYIHAKGLKFGIYSSPGAKTCAGFEGSFGHEDQDAQQYANWGVDYMKHDSCFYAHMADSVAVEQWAALLPPDDAAKLRVLAKEKLPIEGIRPKERTDAQKTRLDKLLKEWNLLLAKVKPEDKERMGLFLRQMPYIKFGKSLGKVKRDIVYSICQYGRADVWEWGAKIGANCWRTTGDISWIYERIRDLGFSQNGLEPYAGPGGWNDPDMLEIGNGKLTPDQQYTHMSLWALLASPLLIGCDMTKMSPLTVSILSNDEVLDVNQDPLGKQARLVKQVLFRQVWAKDMEDGSKAVGLFVNNKDDVSERERFTVTWSDLGITGPQVVRDLWRQKDLGTFDGKFTANVPRNGVVLVKIRPAGNK